MDVTRTSGARANIFANRPEESAYFFTDVDPADARLTGEGSYTVTFAPGFYLLAGPGWDGDVPDGIRDVFRSTTDIGWDPPGDHEGIGLQPVPMLASGVRSNADVAIWALGDRSVSWGRMVGSLVTGVDLHYVRWEETHGSLWCPRITFHGEHGRVEVVMGDSQDSTLVPSANAVAVLHPGTDLPDWPGLKN